MNSTFRDKHDSYWDFLIFFLKNFWIHVYFFYILFVFLLELCDKVCMSNILGLKCINIDALVRGCRVVFTGEVKIKFSFSVPFINLLFCSVSWLECVLSETQGYTDVQGEMQGPTAEGGKLMLLPLELWFQFRENTEHI